jgi:hypothetical protein
MTLRSSLGAQLRSNLIQQATNKEWDENPLITIGLTPQILQLGLDPEQLYEFCKGNARTLFMAVHPDKVANRNIPEELVNKYSTAFELIKVRLIYDEALREFKLIANEGKSEINELNRRLNKTREELRIALEKVTGYEITLSKKEVQQQFVAEAKAEVMATESGLIPGSFQGPLQDFRRTQGVWVGHRDMLEGGARERSLLSDTKSVDQATYLLAIKLELESSPVRHPDLEALPRIKAMYDEAYALHHRPRKKGDPPYSEPRLDDLLRESKDEFSRKNLHIGDLADILKGAKIRTDIYPRIQWGLVRAYLHYGFKFWQHPPKANPITPKFMDQNPEFNKELIIMRFVEGIKYLRQHLLSPLWVHNLDFHPVILRMEKGYYTETRKHFAVKGPTANSFRALGSFLSKPELLREPFQQSGVVSEEFLKEHVHPLVQKNSILVSAPTRYVLQSGKTTELQVKNYYDRIRAMERKYEANYFILEVK